MSGRNIVVTVFENLYWQCWYWRKNYKFEWTGKAIILNYEEVAGFVFDIT